MSHRGFSIARNIRTIPKGGMKIISSSEPIFRKDASDEDARLLAIGDANVTASRPRVFIDVAIDGTPAGRIICELYSDIAPRTAENFRALCTGEKGLGQRGKPLHFRNCIFHKVIPNLGVECGDVVKGSGTGGDSIYGPAFDDETFDVKHSAEGILTMWNGGLANNNGSQFIILTRSRPELDGQHVAFGCVLSGMDVVRRVESCGTSDKCETRLDVKDTLDECVSFKPKRSAYIRDCGEIVEPGGGMPAPGLALKNDVGAADDGRAAKRARVTNSAATEEEVRIFHILKKHAGSLTPQSWQGEAVKCTKGKAKVAIANFRKRIEAAPSAQQVFVELAREHSDSNTAQQGGDLGTLERGSLEAELEDAAFALAPGQLSEVIETMQGIHLLLRAP